ncbi:MAG: protein kinase [Planctomycetota bacterium]|nr:protein kinase [Planctomycetota bacterium]
MLTELCPDRQQLRDFVTGRLPESSLDAIAEHLETCNECESNIATLDSESDSFINELKCPAGDESFINEYEFHEAVSVVQAYESDAPQLPKESSRKHHVGQYMLVERLGSGGMGTVYKALHTKLDKFVALKLLRTKRMLDDRAIARFEREMKAVGKLKHENIVQASDAGEADGKQFLVMEYIEGAEFSELIARSERLSIADACELVRQAAIGLQHAHEHGLVHRDMKPSNLMLAKDGSVKILDLGLAGFAGEQFTSASECNTHTECDDLTLDGQIMGTAEYIAPEQAENSHDVDIRADIYGLGCTLYALLVGVPPFQRHDFATPKQLINAHRTSVRPKIADLPPELARIIDRMLAIDPSDRFSTPAEVADALGPFTINANVGLLLSPERKSTHDESDVRWASKPVEGRLWKALLQKKVLVALAILAVIAFAAFGIVFNLKTPYGTVEIETDDPNVEISVSQAGKEIEIINAASGWDIRLKEGTYDLNLKSGNDKFKLSDNTVTISRDNKIVLRVTLKNTALVVSSDPLEGNVALSARGATVEGPASHPHTLLDGETTGYHGTRGWARSLTPAAWTVTLPREYPLRQIRLLLYDRDSRAFRFTVETSVDGKKYEMVADHSEKWSKSWQILPCPGRPVRHIRVQCLDSTYNDRPRESGFYAVELEAYCHPPEPQVQFGVEEWGGNLEVLNRVVLPRTVESLAIQRLRQIGVKITEQNGIATRFTLGNSAKITDADLAMLESLSSLENFTLVRCDNVTDAGFTHLKHLPRLQTLNLSPSNITDAGLANVKGMKDLWRLSLNSPAITDAGMVHLTHLASLQHLILSNTQVTAAGLTRLTRLKNLNCLQLINTQITPTEVEELRKLLPKDCEIQLSVVPPPQTLPIEVLTSTTLPGHENHVNSAVFSPNGKTLAAGDAAGTVILWDVSTQRKLRTLANVQPIE